MPNMIYGLKLSFSEIIKANYEYLQNVGINNLKEVFMVILICLQKIQISLKLFL